MENIKLGPFEVTKIEEKTTETDDGEKTVYTYSLGDIADNIITLKTKEKREYLTVGGKIEISFKNNQANLEEFEDQDDTSEAPDKASKKQLDSIQDMRKSKINGDEIYQNFLYIEKVDGADNLNKIQASNLLVELKLLDDACVEIPKEDGMTEAKGRKKPASKKK